MAVLEDIDRPTDGIRCEQPHVSMFVGAQNLGTGTLFICENILTWIVPNGLKLHIPYPNIILHAISRDLNAFSDACLYLHSDVEFPSNLLTNPDESDDSSGDDADMDQCAKVSEIRFVPLDKDSLSPMFTALAECQALNSETLDTEDEDDESNDLDVELDEFAEMHLVPNGTNGNSHHVDDPDIYEDAPQDDG